MTNMITARVVGKKQIGVKLRDGKIDRGMFEMDSGYGKVAGRV